MTPRKKVYVVVCYMNTVDCRTQTSVTKAAWNAMRNGIDCDVKYHVGSFISRQRNDTARNFLETDFDYLMFVDSDMIIPEDAIIKLINCNKDISGIIYHARRDKKFHPICYMEDCIEDSSKCSFVGVPILFKTIPPFQCKALGLGCCLITRKIISHMFRPDVIKKWGYPFSLWDMSNGLQLGEDLSFFHRVNLSGFEVWAVHDITIGHIDERIIYWQDYIDAALKEHHYCNDIEGWMTMYELNWLYQHAKYMSDIVEIGSWKGRSTHALASGCSGMVYAIDHFEGSKEEQDHGHEEARDNPDDVYKQFINNIGKFKNVNVFRMENSKALDKVPMTVDMVFIDGGHTTPEVSRDLELWAPKAKKLVCGHDYNWDSVKAAVDQYFKKPPHVFESIWYIER